MEQSVGTARVCKSDSKIDLQKKMNFSLSFFDSENSKLSMHLDPESGTLRPALEWMNSSEHTRVATGQMNLEERKKHNISHY